MTNEEKMLGILAGMSLRLDSVDARLSALETTTLKTNIEIETEIKSRLDALADGFSGILETRVTRGEFDELTERVELLKMAQ